MSGIPNDSSVEWATRALDWCVRRHRVVSSNIVNRDTPGYRAKDVNFSKVMEQIGTNAEEVLSRTDPTHLPGLSGGASNVLTEKAAAERPDGNSVNLAEQMANLTENNFTYEALLKHVNGKFQKMKLAIQGG
jgi:flagellar basal-body rod protein FlgB